MTGRNVNLAMSGAQPNTNGGKQVSATLPTPSYEEALAALQQLATSSSPFGAAASRYGTAFARLDEKSNDPADPEQQLRRAEARYRGLVEQIPAVTFMAALDEGLNEFYVSPQIETLLGFSQKEWLGNPVLWYQRLHPDDQERWHVEFARTCAAGMHFSADYRFIARDGHVVWVHGEAQVVRDDAGRPLFLQGIAFDISESKRAEEQMRTLNIELERRVAERTAQLESANKELQAFSYSVSHDLRAPLRTMFGFSQALEEDCGAQLDDNGRDYLRRIRNAAQNMEQLIEGMLRLSRASRSELRGERVDLSSLAQTVFDELKFKEPERQVSFVIAPGLFARGDATLLTNLLENLLANAWKYTSKHPQARIEFGMTERDGARAFFVRDDGAGFDMSYASKLFGAFQRLHTGKEFPGTGVGLATVQRIVHRHGGRVWAESAVEQGATFYFTLSSESSHGR